MNIFYSFAQTRKSIPLILVFLLGEMVNANQKSIQILTPKLKEYCRNIYDIQQAYQSEVGHFASSIHTINSSQNTNFPDSESGYKVKIKAGNNFFKCQLINQENDTLTLSNLGELKRGNDLLFDFSVHDKVQSNSSPVKINVEKKSSETKPSFPVVVRKTDTIQIFDILKSKFRLVKTTASIDKKYGLDSTVEQFKIIDITNTEKYKFFQKLDISEDGYNSVVEIQFIQIIGSSWKTMLALYTSLPSAPPSGNSIQIANLTNGSIKFLPSDNLQIDDIIQDSIEKKENVIRLKNDVLNTTIHVKNFELIFPFKLNFDSTRNSIISMRLDPMDYDKINGYAGFKNCRPIRKEKYNLGAEINVSKTRDFKSFSKISIPPLKKLKILSVDIPLNKSIWSNPNKVVESVYNYDLIRVKIKINENIYWIKLDDADKIGFPDFG